MSRKGDADELKSDYFELIEANPVIAAVKNDQGLDTCCDRCGDIKIVFILYGDVCSIGEIVQRVKDAGKIAMVHVDLIDGLNSKEIAVDYIHRHTQADGIISTRPAIIKRGKELGLYTTLRIFVLDSMAYENIPRQLASAKPDMVEILPGLMPKIIRNITKMSRVPVIAGGLISDKEDVMSALSAGAISVSSTNSDVWML
ncbi:MAG: glycerol-3-phosphate responsive antiterminator [Clostridiales bacterium]|nr:glycerol-3-phosphate responsive antiterminator [Clostridiales bacterium]